MTKYRAFQRLLKTAKWALRQHYTEKQVRSIEIAFANDEAEIICIAARDLRNACLEPSVPQGGEDGAGI